MTERSRPWDGTTTGDATEAAYDAPTEIARVFRATVEGLERSAHKGGVVNGAAGFNDYSSSTPGANTTRIASGIGWNQGTWHESDANVDFTIATPASSTRVDRIVLRKSWSGQTVRLTRIAGTEGAGAPALTQTFGTTWDVPLWQVSITTGAAITYTDDRPMAGVHAHTAVTDGGALTSPVITDPIVTGQVVIGTGVQTLPTVSGNTGKWRFYKATTLAMTITPASGQALWAPGETAARGTNVTYSSTAGESTNWYCNGTNWICI